MPENKRGHIGAQLIVLGLGRPYAVSGILLTVFGYVDHLGLRGDRDLIRADALEWATTRGARSGRTAWQFIQDLAGRSGQAIAS